MEHKHGKLAEKSIFKLNNLILPLLEEAEELVATVPSGTT